VIGCASLAGAGRGGEASGAQQPTRRLPLRRLRGRVTSLASLRAGRERSVDLLPQAGELAGVRGAGRGQRRVTGPSVTGRR